LRNFLFRKQHDFSSLKHCVFNAHHMRCGSDLPMATPKT
jgi:hypothetical protein